MLIDEDERLARAAEATMNAVGQIHVEGACPSCVGVGIVVVATEEGNTYARMCPRCWGSGRYWWNKAIGMVHGGMTE